MTVTKEQERNALNQIRKIVEDLGDNSYLAITFEGLFDLAEENIRCDFGCSVKSYIDMYCEEREKNAQLLKSHEAQVQLLKHRIGELEGVLSSKESIIRDHEANFRTLEQSYETAKAWNGNQEAECASLRHEVLKLKAKLYDLLISED